MSQSTTIMVLVAALLITTLSCCTAENVYCVISTATSCSSCTHSTHCATLTEYAQDAKSYFTSGITMVFLQGVHVLDTNITVAIVARLTMHGESSSGNRATIVCSGSVGLSFTSMVELRIDSLAFTSCGRKYLDNHLATIQVALYFPYTQNAELVNCSFHDNLGTALRVYKTNITLAGNTEFTHNYMPCGGNLVGGGGVAAVRSTLIFTGNTTFLDNRASCSVGGGAIYTLDSTVILKGISNFINNAAAQSGGAINANHTALTFTGTNNFINNSANWRGGAISTYGNNVLNFSGASSFINNSANAGGAISANVNSSITFNGTIYFTNNGHYSGGITFGGGVYMGIQCTVSILPNTTMFWENNRATLGGAIYVRDVSPLSYCTPVAPYVPKEMCFFQLPGQNLSNGIYVKLVIKNNLADDAGSVLYGGVIDNCKLTHGLDSHSSGEVFDMIVHNNDTHYNTTSKISTGPVQICPCENNLPDCIKEHHVPHTTYPGETFQVSVVAVGQRNGTVNSNVISSIDQNEDLGHLPDSQYLQKTKNTCTDLNYTIFSLSKFVSIMLYAAHSPCSSLIDYKLLISVKLNQTCPPGFNISKSKQSCVCDPKIQRYTNSCTITNGVGQITRDSSQQFWVGYDNHSDELILHPQCPFDYCVNDTVVFPVNNTDTQCANNRSGLLCGKCKESYSLVFGSSHCKKCTDNHLVLFIPFALMGVALVFFLLVCKLTVATGVLSGLVFYANVVGVNRTIFLPVEPTNAFSICMAKP